MFTRRALRAATRLVACKIERRIGSQVSGEVLFIRERSGLSSLPCLLPSARRLDLKKHRSSWPGMPLYARPFSVGNCERDGGLEAEAVRQVGASLAAQYMRRVTRKEKPLRMRNSSFEKVNLAQIFQHPLISGHARNLNLPTAASSETGLTLHGSMAENFRSGVRFRRQAGDRDDGSVDMQREGVQMDEVFLPDVTGESDKSPCSLGPLTTLLLGPPGSGKTTCFAKMLPHAWAQVREGIWPLADSGHWQLARLDVLRKVKLLLVVEVRTHLDVEVMEADNIVRLFQLDRLGLDQGDVERVERFLRNNDDPDQVWIIVDGTYQSLG